VPSLYVVPPVAVVVVAVATWVVVVGLLALAATLILIELLDEVATAVTIITALRATIARPAWTFLFLVVVCSFMVYILIPKAGEATASPAIMVLSRT
jgi:H+/Cl- antiporter ClcA